MRSKLKIIRALAGLEPKRALLLAEQMKCNKPGLDYRRRPLLEASLVRDPYLLGCYILDTVGHRIQELELRIRQDSIIWAYYCQRYGLERYAKVRDVSQHIFDCDMEMIRCA